MKYLVRQKGIANMYGTELLVWVPDIEAFGILFLNNATLRMITTDCIKLLRKAATFTSKRIEKGEYIWYGATVAECTEEFVLPAPDEVNAVLSRFLNPPADDEVEIADDDGRER